jgi:pimeloyl-ACP methyl ester carboxylesterase
MRRAYFDCRFGQLHVRTAFPTTGGFDEGVTLVCLHPEDASSRVFRRFLPEIATDRSVYAPDLPGFGESDAVAASAGKATAIPHPAGTSGAIDDAANAVADLAADLRLRAIDLLGFRLGATVAMRLAATRPELVRRLVLVAAPPQDEPRVIIQPTLVVRLDSEDYAPDLFESAPEKLARRIGAFLSST